MGSNICIIGVYFGNFDNYFNLWMDSAIKNPTIDFLLVTDQENVSSTNNIRVENTTLGALKDKIENKLGMKVSLKKPYKLCDFKPAYGFIFEEYIENYDYWGHCDFDLIWGDIRYFLEKYEYEKYDKFLDRGHLTLYKNTVEINKLFMTEVEGEVSYKTVYSSEHAFLFDEGKTIQKFCSTNNIKVFQDKISADIDIIYRRFRHAISNTELTKNYPYQIFYYENGHVFMSYIEDNIVYKKEYPYIHLQKRKNLTVSVTDFNSYYITNEGFFDKKNEDINLAVINRYNHFPGSEFEENERKIFESRFWKVKLKNKVSINPIGKLLVQIYDRVKWRMTT